MKTEETLTTDSQPVTWWGYLLTFLAIGLIWWAAWVPAELFPTELEGIMGIGAFFGAHAMTFSLLMALTIKSNRLRFRCRLFAFLLMPLTLVLVGLTIQYAGGIFQHLSEQFILLSIQFIALLILWLVDFVIRKVRHHGV